MLIILVVLTEASASAESQDAFEKLVRDYYVGLLRFFSRRGCAPEECEDLAQETFLRAHRSFEGFRGEAKASTWLITIATNLWRNRRRDAEAAKRDADEVPLPEEGLHVENPGPHSPPLASPDPLPQEEAIHLERRRLLRDAMDELPAEMRRSVMHRVYQEMSFREIAEILGVSVATAKSQVSRAQDRLRSVLAEHYPELESHLGDRKGNRDVP